MKYKRVLCKIAESAVTSVAYTSSRHPADTIWSCYKFDVLVLSTSKDASDYLTKVFGRILHVYLVVYVVT